MFLRRIIYFLVFATIILVIAYFIQPYKKGEGTDPATRYELVKDWLQLPPDLTLGNPTGLAIDTDQNLVVFHRAGRTWPWFGMPNDPIDQPTMMIVDKNSGAVIQNWGKNLFIMPHGLSVDSKNNIWVTDAGRHQVFKFDHSGRLLMVVGVSRTPGNDSIHFNRPTDVAVAADGSFYVTDGYGNSRVVKFDSAGTFILQWGRPGDGPGQFNIPHSISLDRNGHVYVADRQNNRICIFSPDGKWLKTWTAENFGNMYSIEYNPANGSFVAVDDNNFLQLRHRGSDIYVFDSTGRVRSRWGRSGHFDGPVGWYHDAAVDKEGNIYVGDILNNTILKFRKLHH